MPLRCRRHFANADSTNENIIELIFKGYAVVFLVDENALNIEILGIYKANEWRL